MIDHSKLTASSLYPHTVAPPQTPNSALLNALRDVAAASLAGGIIAQSGGVDIADAIGVFVQVRAEMAARWKADGAG